MDKNRDPKFLIVRNYAWPQSDDPNLIMFNTEEHLILRDGEKRIDKVEAKVELLRFPEYFEIISEEKYVWEVYFTSERIIVKRSLDKIRGAFELLDHLDNNGTVIVADPLNELDLNHVFKIVDKRKKEIKELTLAFQIAYSRISSISITKIEGSSGNPIEGGIEIWYKDSESSTDSQIIISPTAPKIDEPYKIGLLLQENSLKEKLACLEKKKELDSSFDKGVYNTWSSALKRAIARPDLLMRGSAEPGDKDSWDPIIFQTQPIQWLSDEFSRTLNPNAKIHSSIEVDYDNVKN
ncbi:MAG: hypothetical protein ACTSU2_09815 [Promethearchaeota archaeon]